MPNQQIEPQTGGPPNHNGRRSMVRLLAMLGGLDLVCCCLIFLCEPHAEHAVTYAGILQSMLGVIFIALRQEASVSGIAKRQVESHETVQKLVIQTNHRMDQMLELTRQIADAKGHADEKKTQAEYRKATEA